MAALPMPYHCLAKTGGILFAARGSSIDSFRLDGGALLSTWSCPPARPPTADFELLLQNPPAKRRKLSNGHDSEQVGKKMDSKRPNSRFDSVASGLDAPAVIALTVTHAGNHVIAVTGEDKSVRVLEHAFTPEGNHFLRHLSQRVMPKRPCAIALTDDDATIIVADKFGDVYSLPVLATELEPHAVSHCTTAQFPEPLAPKAFDPAANELTVHSQRNRKALENQRRQNSKPSEKSEPIFEHKLLLGHVSMLTDIALATSEGRNYIITADRDEHIRISRGIPQTHIIEGFCLGHTEFVSRLCVPTGRSSLLISGGGDNFLFVWNWSSGLLLSKIDLKPLVRVILSELNPKNRADGSVDLLKVAVSGISHAKLIGNSGTDDVVIVFCEGVPALFAFLLTPENQLEHIQSLKLPANALAVVISSSDNSDTCESVIVSIDSIHRPGSITELAADAQEPTSPLLLYSFQNRGLSARSGFGLMGSTERYKHEYEPARFANILYNFGKLRKRDEETREDE